MNWKDLFLQRMMDKYGDIYDYSKVVYRGRDIPVTITCPLHGDFSLSPRTLLCGYKSKPPHGCPECSGLRRNAPSPSNVKKERPAFDFLAEARRVHGDRYEYLKIPSSKNRRIPIVCHIHGIFYQRVDVHLLGSNFPVCAKRHQSLDERRKSFLSRARDRWGDKYSYRDVEYVNNDTPVTIYCKEHNRSFSVSPDTHLRSGSGCPLCSDSRGEVDIRLWLEEHKVNFIKQYKIPNMNRRLKLKYLVVDFYLPDYRLYIEFNGKQHYENVKHFYSGKRTFDVQRLRDITLRDYCKRFCISLVEIPYNHRKNIPSILHDLLYNQFQSIHT